MGKYSLFALAVAAITNQVHATDECVKGNGVTLTDISDIDYNSAWEITLDGASECWFLTFQSAYASWELDTNVSVKYQIYRPPMEGESTCKPIGEYEPYVKGSFLHTDQTEWPYTEPGACSHVFVFTNNLAE